MSSSVPTGKVYLESIPEPVSRGRGSRPAVLSRAGRIVVACVVSAVVLLTGVPDLGHVLTFRAHGSNDAAMLAPNHEEAGEAAGTFSEAAGEVAAAVSEEPTAVPEIEPSPTAKIAPTSTPTGVPLEESILALAELRQAASTPAVPTSSPGGKIPQFVAYRVVPGDTLLSLAVRFGITPETILWANELGNGELLRVGQDLVIPPVSGILHTVQKGDNLSSIADAYMVEAAAIQEVNGLNPTAPLPEGGLLIVPGGVKRTTQPIEGLPSAPSQEQLAESPRYVVRAGDSLISIADAFGVRASVIQVANGLLDPDKLRAGQELVIPGGKPTAATPAAQQSRPEPTPVPATATIAPSPVPTQVPPAATPAPPAATAASTTGSGGYVVKVGDTVYSIARVLGVQPTALQQANGIADPSKLRIGQVLTVPGGTQPPAPSSAATPTATKAPAATATPVPTQAQSPTPRPTQQPTQRPAVTAAATVTPSAAPQPPAGQIPSNLPKGDRIAAISQKYLGYRYLWGGHSPTGFDCTGFTWYVYKEAGYTIPQHDLPGQMNAGPKIPREQLAPGDLVFFQNTYTSGLSHVGIFLGGGRFINAETEKVGVQIRALSDPYWSTRFVGASRP